VEDAVVYVRRHRAVGLGCSPFIGLSRLREILSFTGFFVFFFFFFDFVLVDCFSSILSMWEWMV